MWQKTSQKRISVTKKINLFLLFFLAISALVIYFVIVQKYLRFILLIIIFIAVISLIIDLMLIEKKFNSYTFKYTEDYISVRKGLVLKKEEHILVSKIYQYNIYENPILINLNLVSIQIETAIGMIIIDYIERETAENISFEIAKRKGVMTN